MLEGFYKVRFQVDDAVGRSVMYANGGSMLGGNSAFAHYGTYSEADGVVLQSVAARTSSDYRDVANAGNERPAPRRGSGDPRCSKAGLLDLHRSDLRCAERAHAARERSAADSARPVLARSPDVASTKAAAAPPAVALPLPDKTDHAGPVPSGPQSCQSPNAGLGLKRAESTDCICRVGPDVRAPRVLRTVPRN